jgi:hypothetical protein
MYNNNKEENIEITHGHLLTDNIKLVLKGDILHQDSLEMKYNFQN